MNEANQKGILLTGLRLLYILELLSKKGASKKEVSNYVKEKTKIENYSKETLKLDINSLIKSGFQLKRTGARENFRYELLKKPIFLKFNKEETETAEFIKNAVLEVLDYKEILAVRNFFNSNKELFSNECGIFDFEGFNSINQKTMDKIDELIQKNLPARIIYSSPLNGRKEFIGYIQAVTTRNNKLYLSLYDDMFGNKLSFRADKIQNIEAASAVSKPLKKHKNVYKYTVTKSFFDNNPILKSEKITKTDDKYVEVENYEYDEFFVVQRLLFIGKNCVKIPDCRLKEKIITILNDTLGVYEKCQAQ